MSTAKAIRDNKKSWIREKLHCNSTYFNIIASAYNLAIDSGIKWKDEYTEEIATLYNEIIDSRR